MISRCRQCGTSVGTAEAVGCVSTMVPTGCSLWLISMAIFPLHRLVQRGVLGKQMLWILTLYSPIKFWSLFILLFIPLGCFYWNLPVWIEAILLGAGDEELIEKAPTDY